MISLMPHGFFPEKMLSEPLGDTRGKLREESPCLKAYE